MEKRYSKADISVISVVVNSTFKHLWLQKKVRESLVVHHIAQVKENLLFKE